MVPRLLTRRPPSEWGRRPHPDRWSVRPHTVSGAGRVTVLQVLRWFCAAVVGAVVSGFAFLLVTGRYANDGPVLVMVAEGHGVHLGDVFVVAGWAVSMAMLVLVAATHQRRRGRPAPAAVAADGGVRVGGRP